MSITLVTDSACDLPADLCRRHGVQVVPMHVNIDGEEVLDGIDLTPEQFAARLKAARDLPKTSQPTPGTFAEAFRKAVGDVLCVTLSSGLSGTYQAARLGAEMSGKRVEVFDSHTASIGQALTVLHAAEKIVQGLPLQAISEALYSFRDQLKTLVMLNTLENVVRGGRLTKFEGLLGNLLNIKPVMAGDAEGKLYVVEKVHGRQRSLRRAVELLEATGRDFTQRLVGISYIGCLEEAQALQAEIVRRLNPREVLVLPMGSTIGTYAGEGGIILAG